MPVARAFQASDSHAWSASLSASDCHACSASLSGERHWIWNCDRTDMPPRRPPRLLDDAYIGTVRIFVTMCTIERQRLFVTHDTVYQVRGELLRTGQDYRTEIVAYCFMPDHLHVLFEGLQSDSNVRKCAEMFRQRSGRSFRAVHSRRAWQEGFYDRVLRRDEDTLAVARYIFENPVRARLCSDIRAYPYSGSSRYSVDVIVASLA
jgi:putative transposase